MLVLVGVGEVRSRSRECKEKNQECKSKHTLPDCMKSYTITNASIQDFIFITHRVENSQPY